MVGDPRGHVTDRAEPEHGDAAAFRDVGVLQRLPRGRQYIGEVDHALVGDAVGNLDVRVLRLWHPQVLGLASGDLAVELRVAEECGAHALLADLCGLTLRLQALVAHQAVAAGDLKGDHDAVARREVANPGADLLHDAHRLVSEHVAFLHERAHHLVEVQVRAADRRGRDPDHGIGRLLDRRVGYLLDAHVSPSVPGDRFHPTLLSAACGPPRPPRYPRPG